MKIETLPGPETRPLTLQGVLDGLVSDGLVSREAADQLFRNRRHARSDLHPLVVAADQKW